MTLRQRRKLKKKQRRKVAPVCDFKKVSYLAGTILEQSSGYRCHCFLLCSFNKTKRFHVAMLPLRNSLQKTFFFSNWSLPHFDVSFDLLLNKCRATWNLFVKSFLVET